jgi:hypothetical protein
MRPFAALLAAITLPLAVGAAPDADPLRSPACTQELEAFQTARAAGDVGVEALRQSAARACLGLAGPPQRAGRPIEPPTAVPPPVIDPPRRPSVRAAPAALPPPVFIERPGVVTNCDAHGCWADDGTRLQRVGPQQVGPRGPCVVQAGALLCP